MIINIKILTCLKHSTFFVVEVKEHWGGGGRGILLGRSAHTVTAFITVVDWDYVSPSDVV